MYLYADHSFHGLGDISQPLAAPTGTAHIEGGISYDITKDPTVQNTRTNFQTVQQNQISSLESNFTAQQGQVTNSYNTNVTNANADKDANVSRVNAYYDAIIAQDPGNTPSYNAERTSDLSNLTNSLNSTLASLLSQKDSQISSLQQQHDQAISDFNTAASQFETGLLQKGTQTFFNTLSPSAAVTPPASPKTGISGINDDDDDKYITAINLNEVVFIALTAYAGYLISEYMNKKR